MPSVHDATMSVGGLDVYVLTTKNFNAQILKGWFGYAFYQVKLLLGTLVITQISLIIQDMLADSGKGDDPVKKHYRNKMFDND